MQSDSVGVERRRLPFTLIENIILEDQTLGRVDILVYLALAKHADGEGICWPSMATIAKLARCASETVASQASNTWRSRGYLKRTARFRPDGGVTSNVYQLMPLEARSTPLPPRKTPPVVQNSLAPVAQDDTNYIHSEQDSSKGESHAPATARLELPPYALQPEEQMLAELTNVPGLVHDRRFREGARRLLAQGKTPAELVMAVRAAAGDPQECGGLSFIADRFPRWARKAQDQERQHRQSQNREAAAAECVERARTSEEGRVRILAEQESEKGRQIVAEAIAQLPWNRRQS